MKVADIVDWLKQHARESARLCLDSRQVRAGDVFFACPGRGLDGRQFISDAVQQGAAAIIYEGQNAAALTVSNSLPVLSVPGLLEQLGEIADHWYGSPSAAVSVVAVTGTNGKTSCVNWIAAALNSQGVPCGTIGTLGATLPDGTNLGGSLTTPDVLTMHYLLAQMCLAGAQVVALEASSIGIEQGRLARLHIAVAAFTNLTHDHLDYHGSLENYRNAKRALFNWPGLKTAILNLDDDVGQQWFDEPVPAGQVMGYSIAHAPGAAVNASEIHAGTHGLMFNLSCAQGSAQVLTRLVGEHNISNVLLVASVLLHLGWDLSRISRALTTLSPVQGRLEWVEPVLLQAAPQQMPLVVVDYAHTPDALQRALTALRDIAVARNGKLVCVFGCGGNRDAAKRPAMGRLAAEMADVVMVTNDNPRQEDPQSIITQILSGMPERPMVQPDRAIAIMQAVWNAGVDDVVLLAGKGHETYQEFASQRCVFDDRQWARVALTWRQGVSLSTDTRTLQAGQVFLALKGENFDGHAYLGVARQRGALAALVEHADPGTDMPQLVVGDTQEALSKMAMAWRSQYCLPVIAVTGSNGKTTTKEMIASILQAAFGEDGMLATRGNLNNHIGVPLTLLRLGASHKAAVVELGMNHPGEIAQLAAIAQPTIALVNNAQREHQEFMHSVQAVARENGSVIESLADDGVAVYPGDDTFASLWQGLAQSRTSWRFGFSASFEVHADQIQAERDLTLFELSTPAGSAMVRLRAPGLHNLRNAMAAAACALAAGVSLEHVALGLQSFNPVSGRMQPAALSASCQLIDDTYNANPDSVRAAIDVLANLPAPRILVLGDMAEVGSNSDAMHAEVGSYARERGVDALYALGVATRHTVDAFGVEGVLFSDVDALVQALLARLPANILVKGSRSARMERVVQGLKAKTGMTQEGHHAA